MPKVSDIFEPGGLLAKSLEEYEQRPEQVKMAEFVARSIDDGRTLVVEAGTGTGKTLAYLVPAILSGKQVVISTGTKNLQEQVYFKDIPFLKDNLGVDFSAIMLKGRSNYLCPERLNKFSQSALFNTREDGKILDEIFSWSKKTKTGDMSELDEMPEGSQVWKQVCSTKDFCSVRRCPKATDCFVSRLRAKAEETQIVVVNHHLFFADLAIRGKSFNNGILPDYEVAIFDEAHQVEEVASQYFGFSVSSYRMEELVRDTVKELDQTSSDSKSNFTKDLDNLDSRIKNFVYSFDVEADRRFSIAKVNYDKDSADVLLNSLLAIESRISAMDKITEGMQTVAERYLFLHQELESLIECGDPDYIYWGESKGRGLFLNASSIDVSEVLGELLYSNCISIFTSATLASGKNFDYFNSRVGLEEPRELLLHSPFDYESQATIYLPRMPEPSAPSFLDSLAEESLKLINLVGGKTLFLFTSFRNMYEIRKRLGDRLKYPVMLQGEAPRNVLLERFRDDIDSVLFATSSFWQGVDVRGEALSCLIIDRLPFASPGDPILSARIDRIRQGGGNPFVEYQVPVAVLGLKQGVGRLIRHRNDRGIMMIADQRIKGKSYGKTFLDSLPPAPVVDKFDDIVWDGNSGK